MHSARSPADITTLVSASASMKDGARTVAPAMSLMKSRVAGFTAVVVAPAIRRTQMQHRSPFCRRPANFCTADFDERAEQRLRAANAIGDVHTRPRSF